MENKKNLDRVSRYISLILRHKPEVGNMTLDSHGWGKVDELLTATKIDMETLEEIVRTDAKGRYSFNEDKTLIRANQGHSINVDLEFKEQEPPEYLYHGTSTKSVDSIMDTGINRGTRQYVHLSKDIETAIKVGKRHGKPAVLAIEADRMRQDRIKFYLSENGVWLTDFVPCKYISICNFGEENYNN